MLAFFRNWAPAFVVDAIAAMSFLTHFASITRGVIDLKDVIFFGSVIGVALYINIAFIEIKKGA